MKGLHKDGLLISEYSYAKIKCGIKGCKDHIEKIPVQVYLEHEKYTITSGGILGDIVTAKEELFDHFVVRWYARDREIKKVSLKNMIYPIGRTLIRTILMFEKNRGTMLCKKHLALKDLRR